MAYTNNDVSSKTGTLLYDLDTTLGQLALQRPANAGTLGVTASPVAGFDIVSTTNAAGVTIDNAAFAVLRSTRAGGTSLYRIEQQSGAATKISNFDRSVADIAIQQAPTIAPPS